MMTLKDAPVDLRRGLIAVLIEIERQRALRPDAPVLIDFFSCQGGSSMGYHRAGFIVVGVDKDPQPNYPFPMVVADAIEYAQLIIDFLCPDAIAGSPPCQWGSRMRSRTGREYEQLIDPFREIVAPTGLPYVIENVESRATKAVLRNWVRLCGSMLDPIPVVDGLLMRRHRLFETGNGFEIGSLPVEVCRQRSMWRGCIDVHGGGAYREGRKPDGSRDGHGNKASFEEAQQLLDVDWMNQHGHNQSIPWRYTKLIGEQLIEHLRREEAA